MLFGSRLANEQIICHFLADGKIRDLLVVKGNVVISFHTTTSRNTDMVNPINLLRPIPMLYFHYLRVYLYKPTEGQHTASVFQQTIQSQHEGGE